MRIYFITLIVLMIYKTTPAIAVDIIELMNKNDEPYERIFTTFKQSLDDLFDNGGSDEQALKLLNHTINSAQKPYDEALLNVIQEHVEWGPWDRQLCASALTDLRTLFTNIKNGREKNDISDVVRSLKRYLEDYTKNNIFLINIRAQVIKYDDTLSRIYRIISAAASSYHRVKLQNKIDYLVDISKRVEEDILHRKDSMTRESNIPFDLLLQKTVLALLKKAHVKP